MVMCELSKTLTLNLKFDDSIIKSLTQIKSVIIEEVQNNSKLEASSSFDALTSSK